MFRRAGHAQIGPAGKARPGRPRRPDCYPIATCLNGCFFLKRAPAGNAAPPPPDRLCLVAPEAPLVVQEGRYLDYTGNRAPPMVCTLGPRCLATRRSGRAQSKRSASVSIPSLLDFVNRASGCDHLEFGAAAIFRNALTTDGYVLENASDI